MTSPFTDLHVAVPGGTGALGTAVVAALLEQGATCHVPNLAPAELEGWVHAHVPQVHVTRGIDLTVEADVERFYRASPPLWASIHLCGRFAMSKLQDTSGAALMQQFTSNALTSFLCTREAVASIRRRLANALAGNPGKGGGRIVNVAARPALESRLGASMAAYAASKAAVASMTGALGEELAPEGIWVNAVAPSIIDTPANRLAMPDAAHDQWPTADVVARAIVQLASPLNGCIRGAVVPLYGRC